MLALSQSATERALERALHEAQVTVQRGSTLTAVRHTGGRDAKSSVEVDIEPAGAGPAETSRHPWLLGADGARSTVRAQLGIDFPGDSFPAAWHLADLPLRSDMPADHGHVFLQERGAFLFLIRVIDPALPDEPAPIWRLISNRPDPLSRLREAEPAGEPIWQSSFHVAHRLASTMAEGEVYLAGDAAHIHSPIGARGMNLGIEDAWVFAELARTDRLAEYDRLRRPVDRTVVRRVKQLSRIAAAEPPALRPVRRVLLPAAFHIPPLRARARAVGVGLDHPLPRLAS
jgi:2-polyprenyl-6-methoxyphenol hydroxylase-like FAD-dependent oxidoreductase